MVTIKDVAKKVGVSPSTVSRVVQNNSSISEETKDRVREAMKELGYVPNLSARNLVTKLTNSIGVVFPPLDQEDRKQNPFFIEALSAINDEARKKRQTTAVATGKTMDELFEDVKLMHLQKRVDGFILLYSKEDDPVQNYLEKEKIPYLLIGTPNEKKNRTNFIDNDNLLMSQEATDKLIELGHKKIYFVTNHMEENFIQDRYFGYRRSMLEHNLTIEDEVILNRSDASTVNAFIDLMKNEKPDALLVVDDMLSIRVLQMLAMNDIYCPEDISIISMNNSVFATLVHPYLSSIEMNKDELSRLAVRQLVDEVSNTQEHLRVKVVVPHEIVMRESVRNVKESR